MTKLNLKALGAGGKDHKLFVISAIVTIVAFFLYLRDRAKQQAATAGTTGLDTTGAGVTDTGGLPTGSGSPYDALTQAIQGLTTQLSNGSGGTGNIGGVTNSDFKLNYAIDSTDTFKAKGSNSGGGGSSGFNLGFKGFSLGFGSSRPSTTKTGEIDTQSSNIFTNQSDFQNISEAQQGKVLAFFQNITGTYAQRQATRTSNQAFENQQDTVLQSMVGSSKVVNNNTQTVNGVATTTNTVHTSTL